MPAEYPIWKKEFWSPSARADTELGNYKRKLETQSEVESARARQDREQEQSLAIERMKKEYEIRQAANQAEEDRKENKTFNRLTDYYKQQKGPDGDFYQLGGAAANAKYLMDQAELAKVTPRGLEGERALAEIPWAGQLADSAAVTQLNKDWTDVTGMVNIRDRNLGALPYEFNLGEESAKRGISNAKSGQAWDEYTEKNPEARVPGYAGASMRLSPEQEAAFRKERMDLDREKVELEREKVRNDDPAYKMQQLKGMFGAPTTSPAVPSAAVNPPKQSVYSFGRKDVNYNVATNNQPPVTPALQPPDMNGAQRPSTNATAERPSHLKKIVKQYTPGLSLDLEHE